MVSGWTDVNVAQIRMMCASWSPKLNHPSCFLGSLSISHVSVCGGKQHFFGPIQVRLPWRCFERNHSRSEMTPRNPHWLPGIGHVPLPRASFLLLFRVETQRPSPQVGCVELLLPWSCRCTPQESRVTSTQSHEPSGSRDVFSGCEPPKTWFSFCLLLQPPQKGPRNQHARAHTHTQTNKQTNKHTQTSKQANTHTHTHKHTSLLGARWFLDGSHNLAQDVLLWE